MTRAPVFPAPAAGPRSPAHLISYLLEPKNWLVVTVPLIGAHADGLAGVGWGLLAVFFAAVLPTLFISHGIRHGRWADRNVGARRPRLIVLAFITASVTAGLILLIVLRAPVMVTGYLAFMLTSVAVLAVITTVWKISIHCAVASGSVAILALTYGPLVLPGFLLVALLGWSRVALRDHTTAQVVGGMVLGALAAVIAYAALAGTAGLSAVCALAHPSPSPLGTLYLPVRGRRFRDGQGIRGSLGRSRPGRQPRCGDAAR